MFPKVFMGLALVVALGAEASAQGKPEGGIAWYGTWEQGLAEAKLAKKPILLVSAAPHCRNVSGLW